MRACRVQPVGDISLVNGSLDSDVSLTNEEEIVTKIKRVSYADAVLNRRRRTPLVRSQRPDESAAAQRQ